MTKLAKKQVKFRVPHPIGGGRYTQAGFWAFIRSGLRAKYSRWGPRFDVLAAARRKSQNRDNPRLKWEFQCSQCSQWFPQTGVEVDHIEPCGQLRDYSDLPEFVRRLFCEVEGLRVVCKPCHKSISQEGRNVR